MKIAAWRMGAVLALFVASGCAQVQKVLEQPPASLYVVLVDASVSTPKEDWQLYESAYLKAVSALEPGDRLVLGLITDASLTRFSAAADRSLPATGIHDDDEDTAKAAREELSKAFAELHSARANRTKILDALESAAQVISGDKARHPSIVVLSDMLEDSEQANFEKTAVTEAIAQKVIETRRSQHALPALQDVSVYVVGASAKDQERYHQVQDFWTKYLQATGAALVTYGRTLPQFGRGV